MSHAAYSQTYATQGNTALKAHLEDTQKLRVIEGARHHSNSRSNNGLVSHHMEIKEEKYRVLTSAHIGVAVAFAFILMLVLALTWLATDVLAADAHTFDTSQISYEEVIVHSGDSLLSIAQKHAIEGLSTQDVVRLIQTKNCLDSASIFVGDRLQVPCSD